MSATTPDALRAGRNAALLKAGGAVAAALALLVGVLLMDDSRPSGPVPPVVQPATTPAPPPAQAAAAPAVPEAVKPAEAAGEAAATQAVVPREQRVSPGHAQPEPPATPFAAPVPVVVPSPPAVPAVQAPARPAVAAAAAPAPAHAAALAALANQPTTPAKDGYLLQLGVFGNPINAGTLQAELAAKGVPARVESRVVLGPFPDRKALEAAQRRLKRDQGRDAVVVPPRGGK